MESRVTGHTGLMALSGSPVGHSGSPAMYNYSFEKLGLDYVYVALDVKEDEVKDAIAAMRLFNMKGGNVTMPDKFLINDSAVLPPVPAEEAERPAFSGLVRREPSVPRR